MSGVALPVGMTPEEAAAHLLAARDYVIKHGWAKGTYEVGPSKMLVTNLPTYKLGAVCAVGAMCKTSNIEWSLLWESSNARLLGVLVKVIRPEAAVFSVSELVKNGHLHPGQASDPYFIESARNCYYDDVITSWNDEKDRTVEDVIIAFEQAAALLKEDASA